MKNNIESIDKKIINSNKKEFDERIFFKLKQLDGDHSIFLGQSILALIALNKSPCYSDSQNHFFIVDLFASLIEELKITPEELKNNLEKRKEEY